MPEIPGPVVVGGIMPAHNTKHESRIGAEGIAGEPVVFEACTIHAAAPYDAAFRGYPTDILPPRR